MPSPNETLADDLIVPFASASAPPCRDALARTALPQLTRLLNRWTLVAQRQGDEYSLTPPHEHALAQALGWRLEADGITPWAARQAARRDRPCAWFTPCHWSVGMEQVTLLPPDGLDLRKDESGALLQALAPWAQEDGLTLSMETPQRWLAEGDALRGLPCASLDRVAHRRVDAWLPRAEQAPSVRDLLRLQNEAQMLFYTHPVNDARQARGALPINGFWISGAGVWQGDPNPGPTVIEGLRDPALAGDWAAWGAAWLTLDTALAGWSMPGQRPRSLTLCGERGWVRYASHAPVAPRPWWQRLAQHLARPPATTALSVLESL